MTLGVRQFSTLGLGQLKCRPSFLYISFSLLKTTYFVFSFIGYTEVDDIEGSNSWTLQGSRVPIPLSVVLWVFGMGLVPHCLQSPRSNHGFHCLPARCPSQSLFFLIALCQMLFAFSNPGILARAHSDGLDRNMLVSKLGNLCLKLLHHLVWPFVRSKAPVGPLRSLANLLALPW